MGFILGQVQTVARNGGKVDFFSRAIQAIESPVAALTTSVLGVAEDFWIGVRDARSLRREVERLKSLDIAANQYQETVDRLKSRIDALEQMNGYVPAQPYTKVYARIVGYFPQQNRATIDRGSKDGLAPHQPVVAANGLVGVIDTVTESRSQILLVTSPQIRIAARVVGEASVPSIIRGETPTRLYLDLLGSDPVYTGETVVTSGHSENIPAGIMIGTIVESIDDPQFGVKRVFVLPSVHMGSVDEVFVLK